MASFAWCPKCKADVEDVEGFCMLGHTLGGSFDDLAQLTGAAVSAPATQPARPPLPAPVRMVTPPPPPPPPAAVPAAAETAAPRATLRSVPPPPPASPKSPGNPLSQVWSQLTAAVQTSSNDPIVAFAPATRMDWGPENPIKVPRPLQSILRKPRFQRAVESLAG